MASANMVVSYFGKAEPSEPQKRPYHPEPQPILPDTIDPDGESGYDFEDTCRIYGVEAI